MNDLTLRFAGKFLLFCLVISALPCKAQDPSVLPSLYSSPEFQEGVLQKIGKPTLVAGQRSVLAAGASPAAVPVSVSFPQNLSAELQYQASDGISRTLRRQIADTLSDVDPVQAAEYRSALVSDDLWLRFERLLKGAGMSTRNLADVLATYYVGSWEIVNQAVAQPQAVRAVRDRLATSLEKAPEIILMTDAEKQRSAEAIGIMTTVATEGSRSLAQQGDQIGFIALQNTVHQSLLRQGIDLKRLWLSASGFVSR